MSFHPQTPQSPSQLSPTNSDPNTSMSSSMTSITTALPTPAHSVNGSSNLPDAAHDVSMADDSPQKRKRPLEDLGERELKKMHLEERRISIDELHKNVGEKYLLCRTPHPPAKPMVSEDLFEMFGLTGLAAEVARVLPNGEKNAIRKTYKGHIKKLGVNGHFDSVKSDPNGSDSLLMMMKVPEEEWRIHFVKGREVDGGFNNETRAKMAKAMSMAKGAVPKNVWDSSVLGELGSGPGAKGDKQTSSAKATAPNTPVHPAGAGNAAAAGGAGPRPKQLQQSLAQEAARPKRNIKKRGYGDSSFEGYGEGFPDDDGVETGYSTGEGDMVSAQKRRKKNHPTAQSSFPPVRQAQSYGPGMVGA